MLTINGNPITINGNFINGVMGGLPPYTLRLKFKDDVTPTFSKGTGVQLSTSPNIWDLTYENPDWSQLLYSKMDLLEVINGNTSNVSSTNSMFYYCNSLTSISLFDTSNVTDMTYMFGECSALTTVPLFDTINVSSMNGMFYECYSLSSVPLFDTSKVKNMGSMFYYCKSLSSAPMFNTSSVYSMGGMFNNCSSLISVPLYDTTNTTGMSNMFYGCSNVQYGALALYNQASTQANPPIFHSKTFYNCGINTQTGSAELGQIPSNWK